MGPEQIVLLMIFAALTLYALLGGADFGAGVWEFNTGLWATQRQRDLIDRSIGPVWEANHVWLIFALVLLFSGFPPAFAAMCRALWIPLLLALLGIVFRGVGFTFRYYAAASIRQREVWDVVFALASTATPFFLGACIGAIASGQLEVAPDGRFSGNYFTGWINTLSVFNAFFVVGMCAYLAAVYLMREAVRAGADDLIELWRRRALATGVWMGILAAGGIVVMIYDAPALWDGFRDRAWIFFASSFVTGVGSLAALWRRRATLAALAAAATVAAVVWGWAVAQFPKIIPPSINVHDAQAPDAVLWTMIVAISIGSVLLFPSLGLLFYLFKGAREPTSA